MAIDNSTIGGNTDDASGVIHNDSGGVINISLSTIAFNKSSRQIASGIYSPGATTTVQSSLVYGNGNSSSFNPTCSNTGVTSNGDNVFDSGSPCAPLAMGDTTTSFPNLDTTPSPAFLPKAHGGIAPVYLPLTGSPLIGHVTNSACGLSDERGGGRPLVGCAAGAVDTATVVVVVGNPSAPTAGDNNIVAQLQSVLGSDRVTVAADNWNGSPSGSAVVVAGSVTASHIGTRLRDMITPFVILKQSLFDKMNMTNSSGSSDEGTTNSTALRVNGRTSSNAGFTSGGYSSGNNPRFTSSSQLYGWGRVDPVGAAAVDGAITSNTSHAAVFKYPAFQLMFNSFSAPAARIGFFATNTAAAALNTAGNRLLQEAVLASTVTDPF